MEEYALIGTFTRRQEIESQKAVGFTVPVLALFDEPANMAALATLLGA